MNKNTPPLSTPLFKSFIGRIRQFSQKLTIVFMTILKLALLVLILLGSFQLFSSLNDKAIYLEAPEVPEKFAIQGYSSKVLARMMADQLSEIRKTAIDSIYAAKQYGRKVEVEFRLFEPEERKNINSQSISFLKRLFGISEKRVASELVLDDKLWSLRLRLPGGKMKSFDHFPEHSTETITKDELETLVKEAGLWLIQAYEPVLVGFYFLHKKDYQRCLELCRVQSADSEDEQKWLNLVMGMAYTQLGNLSDAESTLGLNSDKEVGNEFPSLCLAKAEAFLMGNDTVQIRSAFEKVYKCGVEGDVDFYIYLGNWMTELEQYRQARECLEKALELEPENTEVLRGLALVLQKTDQLEEANRYFERAYRLKGDKSRIGNKYTSFLHEQGRAWVKQKMESKAWETYLKILEINPENKEARTVFDNYWASMDPMFEPLGIRQVLNPDSMSLLVREGWMQFMVQEGINASERGELSRAEELFSKVKMVDPDHPGLTKVIEELYKRQLNQSLIAGNFVEFRKKYRIIVREGVSGTRLKQAFLPRLKSRIRDWEKQKDAEEELEAYNLWYEWDKGNAGVLMAWAKAYARMGNLEQAEEKMLKAYQMNVNLFAVISIWADLLFEAEEYNKAIEKYSLADKMTPNTFRVLRNWGNALHMERAYSEAITKYQASLRALDTTHILPQRMALFQIDIYIDLGICHKAIGNSDFADDWYSKAYRKAMQLLAQSPSVSIASQTYLKLARMSASQRDAVQMVDWLTEARQRGLAKEDISMKDPVFKQYSWKIEEFYREKMDS